MKHRSKRFLSILLSLALVLGLIPGMSLTALATDNPSYTLDGTITGGGSAYANDSDITQNNVSWKVKGNTMENPWRIGGKSLSGENRDVYSTGTINSGITEVMLELGHSTITVNSVTLTVASDSSFSTVLAQQTKNGVAANSTLSFKPTSGTWSNAYYKFTFNVTNSNNSNKYVQFKAAKFYAAAATVPVTGVTLNPSAAQSINVGGSVAFTATVAPDGATDKTVKWSTTGGVTLYSDENCTAGNEIGADATSTLTVYAKGISAGSATVTATSNADNTKTASCAVTVNAAPDPVSYKAASVDETTHAVTFADATCTAYTVVTSSDEAVTWSEGWYAVKDTVTVSGLISFTGDVNLILCDGATLTVNGGVSVNEGNTLNIYAQSEGSTAGALTVSNVADYNAGIGGGNHANGGDVTIYGGTVAVTGGSGGAGIGGGYEGSGGSVTIYGGTVTAKSGSFGAGIGGGNHANGGDVTIYGGTVNATGGAQGAGIGGGNGYYNGSKTNGDGGTVTIHGGTVTATGGGYGAGIGGGAYGNGGTVTNNGGTVNATGGVDRKSVV